MIAMLTCCLTAIAFLTEDKGSLISYGVRMTLHALWIYRGLQLDEFFLFDSAVYQGLWWIYIYRHLPVPIGWGNAIGTVIVSGALIARKTPQKAQSDETIKLDQESKVPQANSHPIPPLLIPARTTHSRFFPKKHSFSYSYLYVGIPVGWSGRSGSLLSADVELIPASRRKYGWFDVNSDDYLSRDKGVRGLDAKLRTYLKAQGVKNDEWSFAYLCTAPRFLGYSFNPVSFWCIYESASKLVMMVLEVNNTFDERRMYLLKDNEGLEKSGNESAKFKQSWPKDFHVSPFNSTKGSYSLQATNPLSVINSNDVTIDNTITLRSSDGDTKLVARVFSEGHTYDASNLSMIQLVRFIGSWCWVGFSTFPRILFEASRLYFSHKLHVWYRPEVLPSSIGRSATTEETLLEVVVRHYFRLLMNECYADVSLTYSPPSGMGQSQTWAARGASGISRPGQEINIRILSPAFYSRFVHYVHTKEALDREGLCADDKSRTVLISGVELIDLILPKERLDSPLKNMSMTRRWRWKMLQLLRCPPPLASYAGETPKSDASITISDIRPRSLSSLDRHVLRHYPAGKAEFIRSLMSKPLIAQRYALGFIALVDVADWISRLLLLAIYFKVQASYSRLSNASTNEAIVLAAATLFTGSLIHIWSFVKG